MGFRNPITSAAAVDTGRGLSDAGVRLYQDTSTPAVPQGVAEWRTGTMTRNATAKLAGGGSGGSAFTLDGGQTQLVDAPTVGLNVENIAAGGYGPVLRLTARPSEGGRIIPDVALDPIVPWTALPSPNPALFTDWPTGAGDTSWEGPRFTKLASGLVVLDGLVYVKSVAFTSGTFVVGPLPVGCRPNRKKTFTPGGWGSEVWRADVNPQGYVLWTNNAYGGGSTVGSYLSLDGIAFVAEQ